MIKDMNKVINKEYNTVHFPKAPSYRDYIKKAKEREPKIYGNFK